MKLLRQILALAQKIAAITLTMWKKEANFDLKQLQVLTELQNRGVKDIFIACVLQPQAA